MTRNCNHGPNQQPSIETTASTRSHIPSLDGIRALAFTLVFVSHAGLGYVVPGGFGVTVFFFLSGYLITSLLRFEYEKTGKISLSNFYLRRIYRIWPPMYITLFLGIIFTALGVFENRITFEALLAQLLQLTNYQVIFIGSDSTVPYTPIFWSLAIEEHFYLLFPLVLLVFIKKFSYADIAKVLLAACAAILAWRCLLVFYLGHGHGYTYYATDTRADSLLYGCVLALWGNPFVEDNSILNSISFKYGKIVILCASTSLLLVTFLYRNEAFRESVRYTLQGVALLPLFYYAVKYSHWPIFSWLELPPIRWLGIISYSLYLSHLMALEIAGQLLNTEEAGLYRSILGLGLALGYSMLMFILVEKPLASLRRKLYRATTQ